MSEFTDKITQGLVRVVQLLKETRDGLITKIDGVQTAAAQQAEAVRTELSGSLNEVRDNLSGSLNTLRDDVAAGLSGKQDVLVYDAQPTENSNHAVTSGAVYAAVNALDMRLSDVEANGGGGGGSGSGLGGLSTTGLVSYFSFDKADSAYVLPDYGPFIGYNNGGEVVAGAYGTALRLGGTKSVVFNEQFPFIHQTGVFTLIARVKLNSFTVAKSVHILCNTTGSTSVSGIWCTLQNTSDKPNAFRLFVTRSSSGSEALDFVVNNAVLADGLYHDYAVTGDGTNFKLYRDGELLGTAAKKNNLDGGFAPMNARIGYTTSSWAQEQSEFDGLWLYNRTLSQSEIAAVYRYRNTQSGGG